MKRPSPASIPLTPGIYMYRDADGRIIYVGKARCLRRRVLSYFRPPDQLTAKTRAMIARAASIETISTGTEKEALLLEAELIKKHRPRYNIVLRDDKQYVLFRIGRKSPFPRIEIVRRAERAPGARYFGPFTSGADARETWKAIHRLFPLRRCTDEAMKRRTRPCLYYDLHQCLAPCVKDVDRESYFDMVRRAELLLSGRSGELIAELTTAMRAASDALEFEHAAELRDRIKAVRATVERQSVVLEADIDMDVITVIECTETRQPVENTGDIIKSPLCEAKAAADTPHGGAACGLGLGILFIRGGRLTDARSFYWSGLSAEDKPELFRSFLEQFYTADEGENIPPRLVVPDELLRPAPDGTAEADMFSPADMLTETKGAPVTVRPPRGDAERALTDMAAANALKAAPGRTGASDRTMGEKIAALFHRTAPVNTIACVDVSHTGGAHTRVGVVVFVNGKPDKSAYRTYTADDAHGDDHAALAAWAERWAEARLPNRPLQPQSAEKRDHSHTENNADSRVNTKSPAAPEPWPDMLLVDGGRGQTATVAAVLTKTLTAAHAQSAAGTESPLPALPCIVAGIAKARGDHGRPDRRAGNISDRIFPAGRATPLPLRAGSPELLYFQRIRDEAHRFSIGRHRSARSRAALHSVLLDLPGIGPATARILWQAFGSLEAIAAADASALAAVPGIGPRRAARLAHISSDAKLMPDTHLL